MVAEGYDGLIPSGLMWVYRDQLLAGGGVKRRASSPNRWLWSTSGCAATPTSSSGTSFSVATAVLKDMQGVGWYYGTLHMRAGDEFKLGLLPQYHFLFVLKGFKVHSLLIQYWATKCGATKETGLHSVRALAVLQ
jgi:hypothetical protein